MFGKKFKFSKKPLALTVKSDIVPVMNNTTQHTIDLLPSNPVQLASTLTGKTIRYTNIKDSSVTETRERIFKIKSVEDISVSRSTGNEYIDVQVSDLDDNGAVKPRRLITTGISIVV
jgi:hypothetical protein